MTTYALAAYVALTEIASDKENDRFQSLLPYIASKAGCSVAQLKRALAQLRSMEIIHVETPKLKGPCTYTLLAPIEPSLVPLEPAQGQLEPSLALNGNHAPRATVEERIEERDKHIFEKPNLDAISRLGAALGFDSPECERFFNHYESKGWKVGSSPMSNWEAALRNWEPKKKRSAAIQPKPKADYENHGF